MTRPALMFALVLLAVPAMAAAPHKQPLPAKEPPAAALSADDLMRQAQAASAKGDADLAFRLAQAAIVADPAKPATYDLLADIYAGAGQGDYARFYYGEALGIDPSDPAATRGTAAARSRRQSAGRRGCDTRQMSVLVLDFGSQVTQLIARRVREAGRLLRDRALQQGGRGAGQEARAPSSCPAVRPSSPTAMRRARRKQCSSRACRCWASAMAR